MNYKKFMNSDIKIKELHSVANELESLLPPEDIVWFRELIDNNEVNIGLEILLVQVYEYDVTIPANAYEILEKVGRGHIADHYFDRVSHG